MLKDDCFNVLSKIPDKSINLIIIDPPYNIGKDKWDKFKSIDDYINFILKVMSECQRVLKDNGSLYLFHNDFDQLTELQYNIKRKTEFKYKQLLIWDKYNGTPQKHAYKGALWKQVNSGGKRRYSNCKEYAVFYTLQDEDMSKLIEISRQNIVKYLREEIHKSGLTQTEIRSKMGLSMKGGGLFPHWIATSQPSLIPEHQYIKMQEVLHSINPNLLNKNWDEIKDEYENNREDYSDIRYTYNQPESNLSILQFPIPNKEERVNHKTQKSEVLIEHLVNTSSNEGDVLLSLFSGSGTDSVVAEKKKRYWIAIEREQEYCDINIKRLKKII